MADTNFRIGLYETLPILRPATFAAGTHRVGKIMPAGNSLLVTLWKKSGAGSVQAVWYDYAVGVDEEPSAKYVIETSPVLAAVGTQRAVIARIHNQVYVDLVVTGGSAEVALLASVVSDFPVELDLSEMGGIEAATGTPRDFTDAGGVVTTGSPQIILMETVPVDKTWRLRRALVRCRAYGKYAIFVDSIRKGDGFTSPAESNPSFPWSPYSEAPAGSVVEIHFEQTQGPASPVSAFLHVTEDDV